MCEAGVSRIILREKDLTESEYEALAERVLEAAGEYGTLVTLHTFESAAKKLDCRSIHMPLPKLMSMKDREFFNELGASVHSIHDSKIAEKEGCTYMTAGHIFDTDCKKGLPGRGLDFLNEVCCCTDIPVYAIGGISSGNIADVIKNGARGVCIMSGLMECDDPKQYIKNLKSKIKL